MDFFDEVADMAQTFSVEKNGTVASKARGFFCGKEWPNTIQLFGNVDVRNGDWLVDSLSKQRYYAKDVTPITKNSSPISWMVKYLTEQEYTQSLQKNSSTVINIQTVKGNSVIGSQENVVLNIGGALEDIAQLIEKLPSTDRVEAESLLQTLKDTESATHPVLVEGALSRFSNLLKKHSDLLIAVGGWAVQLLIGQ